jgi:hypothetical protein
MPEILKAFAGAKFFVCLCVPENNGKGVFRNEKNTSYQY